MFKKEWRIGLLILFFVADLFVWFVVWQETPTHYLKVAFLNIGQGDAIYIESPVHNKMMIDGGPSQTVMGELQKVMPFYSRTVDTLLVTNPDADHYSGFLDVFDSYKVNRVIEPGTHSDTDRYKQLETEIHNKNIPEIIARRGQIIHLGGGADLEILFPDRDASKLSTNEGSIMAKLVYGSTSVMFTGDAPNSTENYEVSVDGAKVKSDILKIAHHGSKTSASEMFYKVVNPKYAVISVGENNRYGHPNKETIDLLNKLKITYFLTSKQGIITALSDGNIFTLKTEK